MPFLFKRLQQQLESSCPQTIFCKTFKLTSRNSDMISHLLHAFLITKDLIERTSVPSEIFKQFYNQKNHMLYQFIVNFVYIGHLEALTFRLNAMPHRINEKWLY